MSGMEDRVLALAGLLQALAQVRRIAETGQSETASAKGVLRTAIISAHSGELFLVKEGETLAARYRVGTVAADAVELNDLVSGTVRRLALRD